MELFHRNLVFTFLILTSFMSTQFSRVSTTTLYAACATDAKLWSIEFSPDESLILANWTYGETRLWDTKSMEMVSIFDTRKNAGYADVSFSPDGNYILISDLIETTVWEINNHSKLYNFPYSEKESCCTKAFFTPDGKFIITSGNMGTKLWDFTSGKLIHEYPGKSPYSGALAQLSSTGKYLLVSNLIDDFASWELWDVESGKKLKTFLNVKKISFLPNNDFIITNSTQGLDVWNITTREKVANLNTESKSDNWWISLPNGTRILTNFKDTKAMLWDTQDQSKIQQIDNFSLGLYGFFSDNKSMFTINAQDTLPDSSQLKIWDLENMTVAHEISLDLKLGELSTFAISKNATYLGVGFSTKGIQLWRVKTGDFIGYLC